MANIPNIYKMPHPPLIIGNWKMNGLLANSQALVSSLTQALENPTCEVVLCPPATLLSPVAGWLEGSAMALGGQDCHYELKGAYTGDISAPMLRDLSCRYVILGHSERRMYHKESSGLVRKKAASAIDAGLIPIICVGESAQERTTGSFLPVIEAQVKGSLPANATYRNTIIAYEPVWAIGSGRIPEVGEIAEVHDHILAVMRTPFRIIYGGSVNPGNTTAIMAIPSVAGLLVGGCSLNADDFLHIVRLIDS